jgi:hypothetical protein
MHAWLQHCCNQVGTFQAECIDAWLAAASAATQVEILQAERIDACLVAAHAAAR